MNSRHDTNARNGFCGLYALSEVSTITFESQCIRWKGPGASLWWIIKQMHYAAWKGYKQVKLSWIIDNHFFNSSLEVSLLFSSATIVILNPFPKLCHISEMNYLHPGKRSHISVHRVQHFTVLYQVDLICSLWPVRAQCTLNLHGLKCEFLLKTFQSCHKNRQLTECLLRKKANPLS